MPNLPPFFKAWRPRLAALGRRSRQLRAATLCQLEHVLGPFLPTSAFQPTDHGAHCRRRLYSLSRTVWGLVWQVLEPKRSCRAVVRQLQALCQLQQTLSPDESTSAYCQARSRLPLERLQRAWQAAADKADQLAGGHGTLAGRPVKAVDGSTLLLADTAANQAAYPQPAGQKPGCGFPLLKLVVLFSLASGAIMRLVQANKFSSERGLFHTLWEQLNPSDILLADRGFGDFPTLASLQQRGVDTLARLHQSRKVDFRRAQSLGCQDGLFVWNKSPHRPNYLSEQQWREVPSTLTVRILRFAVTVPGFRPSQITLVTTLLDPKRYTPQALAEVFLRRWRLELCLDDLKTTLGMEHLRTQSPDMVDRELAAHLLAHNLLRCLMAQAALTHQVDLARISFKGTVDALQAFAAAMTRTCQSWRKRRLWDKLLLILATDLVPRRPDRREPRVRKRRPKHYPLMQLPRATYKRKFQNKRSRIAQCR